MRGRIMHVTPKRELLDEAVRAWPAYAANFRGRGLIAVYLLVDRESGVARSVSIWASQDVIDANENRADLREQFMSFEKYYADSPHWDYYDVAVALHNTD